MYYCSSHCFGTILSNILDTGGQRGEKKINKTQSKLQSDTANFIVKSTDKFPIPYFCLEPYAPCLPHKRASLCGSETFWIRALGRRLMEWKKQQETYFPWTSLLKHLSSILNLDNPSLLQQPPWTLPHIVQEGTSKPPEMHGEGPVRRREVSSTNLLKLMYLRIQAKIHEQHFLLHIQLKDSCVN